MSSDTYWADLRTSLTSIPESQRLAGSRILVTGATGLICSSVIDLLLLLNREHGAAITVYAAGRSEQGVRDRFSGFGVQDGLVFVPYDATAADAVSFDGELDFIVHGASNANPAMYMQEPVGTMLANILGLSTMFELARSTGSKRVMYVSSSEVYGRKESAGSFHENDYGFLDILNTRAGYPSSKRAGESLCVAYGMQYGLDSVIVRPGHIYGPAIRDADNRVSAEVTRRALVGEDVLLKSAGTQQRSYCHSLDCASAMLTVLLHGEHANAYNISNPHSICTVREMAEAIAAAGGVQVRFDLPSDAGSVVHNLMENSSLDSTKLEELGWTPVFDLPTGTQRTLRVLQESGGSFSL